MLHRCNNLGNNNISLENNNFTNEGFSEAIPESSESSVDASQVRD
jgi:hypothetical protein